MARPSRLAAAAAFFALLASLVARAAAEGVPLDGDPDAGKYGGPDPCTLGGRPLDTVQARLPLTAFAPARRSRDMGAEAGSRARAPRPAALGRAPPEPIDGPSQPHISRPSVAAFSSRRRRRRPQVPDPTDCNRFFVCCAGKPVHYACRVPSAAYPYVVRAPRRGARRARGGGRAAGSAARPATTPCCDRHKQSPPPHTHTHAHTHTHRRTLARSFDTCTHAHNAPPEVL
jgi:hypothetical protein